MSLYINFFNALFLTNVKLEIFPKHTLTLYFLGLVCRFKLWTTQGPSIDFDIILEFKLTHPYNTGLQGEERQSI